MPEIDVSDVINDPFIAGEGFTVIRRREKVNDDGIAEKFPSVFSASGNLQPDGVNGLLREEAYSAQAKTLLVVTTFRLYPVAVSHGGTRYQPDLIYWDGNYYIIKTFLDYNKYGAGFVEAQCMSIDFVDFPPPPGLPQLPYGALLFNNPANSGLLMGVAQCF